jgi:hypothetical protein
MSFCNSISISVFMFACMSVDMSVCECLSLSECLSFRLSAWLYFCCISITTMSVCQTVCPSACSKKKRDARVSQNLVYDWGRVGIVEGLYCKRTIQCLASSEILTPHPLTGRRVCTTPPLVRGEDTLAEWRGGGGSIVRKTPDTALYSIYVSPLWLAWWKRVKFRQFSPSRKVSLAYRRSYSMPLDPGLYTQSISYRYVGYTLYWNRIKVSFRLKLKFLFSHFRLRKYTEIH